MAEAQSAGAAVAPLTGNPSEMGGNQGPVANMQAMMEPMPAQPPMIPGGQAMAAVPPVATGMPFPSASLYVGDLHPDVTEALLYDIFNAVGPVASIRVCRDAVTRRSLGYAYVNFHNGNDAERALETMNYTMIKDRPCRIMWSQRDPSLRKNGAGNVFVKHLDLSIDNKALYDTFSLFGNILSCKVVTDQSGKSRGYGFVHFETVEAADEAIKKINGMLIAGKEVFVGKFLKRNDRPSAKEWTNIYVKNIPKSWTTDDFEDFFAACGPVASAIIMTEPDGKSRGFGFVDFAEHEAAEEAVNKYNGYELDVKEEKDLEDKVDDGEKKAEAKEEKTMKETETDENKENNNANGEGDKGKESKPSENSEEGEEKEKDTDKEEGTKPESQKDEGKGKASEAKAKKDRKDGKLVLVVCRAQKKTERERELNQKFEELKLEKMHAYQGVNLYIKNLDDRVDDQLLRKEFERFGTITSAKVMRDKPSFTNEGKKPGQSKGFGFVCFTAPEEAIRAVTEMNNKLLLGKPIYVALAQRKEQRRAQLEAQHRQQQRMMNSSGLGAMPMQPGMFPFNNQMNNPMNPSMYSRYNPQVPNMTPNMQGVNPSMNNMGAGMNGSANNGPISNNMGQMGNNNPPRGSAPSRGMPQQYQNRNAAGDQPGQNGLPQGMNQKQNGMMGRNNAPMGPPSAPNMAQGMRGNVGMQPNRNLQFNSNARNTGMPGSNMGGMQQMQNPMGRPPRPGPGGPQMQRNDGGLSSSILSSVSPEERKTMIGEKLYPMVQRCEPNLAAKITGMLLEMDNLELLHLLESPDALMARVREALEVLQKANK